MAGEGKFTIVDKEGKMTECDILFTFESDETHKNYIVYTDNSYDEKGNICVYASTYDPKNLNTSLAPIESDKEWKIIEIILEEIQKEVHEDLNLHEDQNRSGELPSNVKEHTTDVSSFETYFLEKKKIINEKEGDIGELEGLVSELLQRLSNEYDLKHVDALFELLDRIKGIGSFIYSNLALDAYEKHNYAVAEMGFRKAVELCENDSLCTNYKNNLAYLVRRGEIRDSNQRSVKEVVLLLRDGTGKKETFSLINMALLWALEFGKESDWDMADNLASFVDQNDVIPAIQWWNNVANEGDAEGYLVHLLMLRHGKIRYSPLGDIKVLFEMVKKEYPCIPEKMNEIITPFDEEKKG